MSVGLLPRIGQCWKEADLNLVLSMKMTISGKYQRVGLVRSDTTPLEVAGEAPHAWAITLLSSPTPPLVSFMKAIDKI